MRLLALLAILALGTGCASIRPDFRAVPRGIEDDVAMIEAIRAVIPEGTPIAQARKSMAREGFKADPWDEFWFPEESGELTAEGHGSGSIFYTRVDVIAFLMTREWTLTIENREGKVGEVRATHRWIGP